MNLEPGMAHLQNPAVAAVRPLGACQIAFAIGRTCSIFRAARLDFQSTSTTGYTCLMPATTAGTSRFEFRSTMGQSSLTDSSGQVRTASAFGGLQHQSSPWGPVRITRVSSPDRISCVEPDVPSCVRRQLSRRLPTISGQAQAVTARPFPIPTFLQDGSYLQILNRKTALIFLMVLKHSPLRPTWTSSAWVDCAWAGGTSGWSEHRLR